MSVNLQGYHYQGTKGDDAGQDAPHGPILLLAAGYPGTVQTEPLALSYPDFMSGKKCYIGYDSSDNPKFWGRIGAYYGPYLFGLGIGEIPAVETWRSYIGSYVNSSGEVISGAPEACTLARCNWVYIIVGEPAEGAHWSSTLPEDGFCANYNQGYSRNDMFALKSYATSYLLNHLKRKQTGGQWKFNGRYMATGAGSGTLTANIVTGLTRYEGFRSWATGWLYPGSSAYEYIRDQYTGGLYPSVNAEPFGNYNPAGSIANPDLINYLTSDIKIPSISTSRYITGTIATASTFEFRENLLNGRLYVYACSAPGSAALPFQIDKQFPGYSYPRYGAEGMWLPSYSCGFIMTSEGVTL